MTSAVDIIAPKPAARPEPSAKASSRDEDRASFADALEAETAEPEAAPTKEAAKEPAAKETASKDEPATPDTNAAAQPAQPQQPQPTPAVNSPEAILAGLTQAVPTDAPTAEAGAATPAIDAAAAAGAGKAATPQPAAPQADAATPDAAEQAGQAVAANTTAKPAAPAQTAPTATATAPTEEAAPLSAPGEERTSATVETASTNNKTTATTTSNAIDPAANKAQGTQNKPAQAAAAATDIKVDVKADTQAPTTTATPIDTLAGRTSNPDIVRVAPAHTAMQNAPATTVQVYQRMVDRFDGRAQRYEIRLDPAELGRVDVRIEVGADKKVHAVLAAHDSAALTDLMRGQRQLERALSDAGIDLAKDGIRFELSSDQNRNSANNFNDKDGNARSANVWRGFNTVDVAVDAQTAAAARPWRSQRLDVVA